MVEVSMGSLSCWNPLCIDYHEVFLRFCFFQFMMKTLLHRNVRAIFSILFLFLAQQGWSAEARLKVADQISLPEKLPLVQGEWSNFFGTNQEILKSEFLRARMEKTSGKNAPGIKLEVTVVKGTSIFLLQATGKDEKACKEFLDTLINEFLEWKKETKRHAYQKSIEATAAAIKDAEKNNKDIVKALTDYRNQLQIAAALDVHPMFERMPDK